MGYNYIRNIKHKSYCIFINPKQMASNLELRKNGLFFFLVLLSVALITALRCMSENGHSSANYDVKAIQIWLTVLLRYQPSTIQNYTKPYTNKGLVSKRNLTCSVRIYKKSLSLETSKYIAVLTNASHISVINQDKNNNVHLELKILLLSEKVMQLPFKDHNYLLVIFYLKFLKCFFKLDTNAINFQNENVYNIFYLVTMWINLQLVLTVVFDSKVSIFKEDLVKNELEVNGITTASLNFKAFQSLFSNLIAKALNNEHLDNSIYLKEKDNLKYAGYKHIFTSPSLTFTHLNWVAYPVHNLSRVASYRPLSNQESPVSFISLATAGFSYSGQGYTIICSGCQRTHDLRQVTTDPSDSLYHQQGCIYIQPDEQLYREEETDSSFAVLSVSDASTTSVITPSNQEILELSPSDLPVVRPDTNTSAEPTTLPSVTPALSLDVGVTHPPTSQQASAALGHPSYPIFATVQKRLESFVNWPKPHIQNFRDLATAGFFFAGYGDCVRCFYCGLGLKSWKPGDNVYVEHENLRPSCPFLQAQLVRVRSGQTRDLGPVDHTHQTLPGHQTNAGQQASNSSQRIDSPSLELLGATGGGYAAPGQRASDSVETDSSTPVPLGASGVGSAAPEKTVTRSLLERENRLLHQLMTCKICKEQPIKDLFLPCGDLYACSQCSQRITHCPLCKKKILGSVTVYFA